MKRYDGRNRIAGQAKNESFTTMSEHGGFSGFHGNFIEHHLDAEFGEHRFDQVVLPHRNAAGDEQDVMLEPSLDLRPQVLELITVAVPDLAGARILVDFDQFIAGRENRNARLLGNHDPGFS